MIKQLWRLLKAEIALHKHNKVNRHGVVRANDQHYHIIENVLPQPMYDGLLDAVSGLHAQAIRENSHWRKGMAMGGHELNSSAAKPWLEYFSSDEFIQRLRTATGIETLALVPAVATHRLSLLFYAAPAGTADPVDRTA